MLSHRISELLLQIVEVDDEVRTSVLDRLCWLFLARSLALDLNAVLQWMRLTITCKLDSAIA